ncbi:DUF721 domain-containing protein [Candidatus Palauibacter sp.]|uniref:DUF721 domain-containing protein n=1 Tax=Candidatus Palauibacter sp. TaxID=3101350 RepID=UPI003B026DAD
MSGTAFRAVPRGEARRRDAKAAERHPEPIGGVLAELLDRMGIRERVERSATAARWERVVGPHIGRVTKVGGIRGGTVFIEVAGAAWMTELNMMRRKLLSRLNRDRTRGRIERIVFVQSGESSPAAARPGRTEKGRG